MKRMICALLAFILLLGLAGCKKDTEDRLEVSQEETTLEPETEETEPLTEETTEETTEAAAEQTEEETEATVAPCENHTWGEWVRWEKATSTTQGKRVRTCMVCGEEDIELEPTLPKTTHTHKYKVEKSDALCEEDGWAYYYCTCGDWYQVELKATGHDWGHWVFDQLPTQTEPGLKTRTCKNCKETESEETPSFQDHTHKFYDVKTEATCTKAGSVGRRCSVCGYYEETKVIPKLGHKWGDWETTKKATETSKGVRTHTCKRCNAKESETTNRLPHKTHKWKTTKVVQPTCTERGYTLQTCTVCAETQRTNYTPATGHLETVEEVRKAPTCTDNGETDVKCKTCGAVVSTIEEPKALGHDWQADGTCSRCGIQKPAE